MKRKGTLFILIFLWISLLSICTTLGSTDEWERIFDDDVRSVAVDTIDQILYIGVVNQRVYRSTDRGKSWQNTSAGIESLVTINFLATDPTNSKVVYACGGKGLYKSTNAGLSWKKINKSCLELTIAVDPTNPEIIYYGRFKSIDGGNRWKRIIDENEIPLGFWAYDIKIDPKHPETVYISDSPGGDILFKQERGLMGIYKSSDAGETWKNITKEMTYKIAIDPVNTQTIYAGGEEGIYKSIDSGKSWELFNQGLPTSFDSMVLYVLIDPIDHRIVYAGINRVGVFFSKNSGETWEQLGRGLPNCIYSGFALMPSNPPNILYLATMDGLWSLELPQREFHSVEPSGKLTTTWGKIKRAGEQVRSKTSEYLQR